METPLKGAGLEHWPPRGANRSTAIWRQHEATLRERQSQDAARRFREERFPDLQKRKVPCLTLNYLALYINILNQLLYLG